MKVIFDNTPIQNVIAISLLYATIEMEYYTSRDKAPTYRLVAGCSYNYKMNIYTLIHIS